MGILQEKLEKQLNHLDEVITNEEYWYSDKFRVLNNEAGAGKSVQTKKSIAKLALALEAEKRIIYVQMFANKDSKAQDLEELKQTVKDINREAKKDIAGYICSQNREEHKKILAEKNVICITHKRYLELCKGSSKSNLIENSSVLIIDEFPNLFESFFISELELTRLQGFTLITEKEKSDIEEMVKFINSKLNKLKEKNNSEMRIVNLQNLDIKKYVKVLETLIENAEDNNKPAHKRIIEIAKQVIQLFSHSSVYSMEQIGSKKYPVLYSFTYVGYILASENNMILDANAGFDMRYKLRPNLFKLDNQSKVYDYKDSLINLYSINTTKTGLKKYRNVVFDVCEYISQKDKHKGLGFINATDKYLVVTDIYNEGKITDFQKQMYDAWSNIKIAHFGALIGKNDWKDYNNCFIIKTPYYSWVIYILQYLFYSEKNLNGNTSCEIKSVKGGHGKYTIFKNDDFNNLKNSVVLGEYYQALKRIARDGRKCTFNVLMNDEFIFNMLVSQFKDIQDGNKDDITLTTFIEEEDKKEKKKAGRKSTKTDGRNEVIKEYLLKCKNEGNDKIEKAEICNVADLRKDKLSKQFKQIEEWLKENNFSIGKGKEQAYIMIA